MNLFRSEEHLSRWLGSREAGATIAVQLLCDLAQQWWDTRLHADWRPRTRNENQRILRGLGLIAPFWTLP